MNRWKISTGLAVAAGALVLAPSAFAKDFVPTRSTDPVPNGCKSNDCSLREAVIAANLRPGSDRILLKLSKGFVLKQFGAENESTPNPNIGDLDVTTGPLKIRNFAKNKVAVINGEGIDRVFQVGSPTQNPGSVLLKRVRIKGGSATSGNVGGGVLSMAGSTKVVTSTISGNFAGVAGGGFAATGAGTFATLLESTVSGNTSGNGGGVVSLANAFIAANNSTIARNTASGTGGGIHAGGGGGGVTLSSVTVAGNSATGQGGGIHAAPAAGFLVKNSIVSSNSAAGGGHDCHGAFGGVARNLIFDVPAGCTGLSSSTIIGQNARLKDLANNGGLTRTVAVGNKSPAVGKATKAFKTDQRGEKRGKKPTIGAYELVKK